MVDLYSVYSAADQSPISVDQIFPREGVPAPYRRAPGALYPSCPPDLAGSLYILQIVTDATPGPYEVPGDWVYGTPDFEAGTRQVTRAAVMMPLSDRKAKMLAQVRAQYGQIAGGGTEATFAPGVNRPVATGTDPVVRLVESVQHMAAVPLTEMPVVTTANDPVNLTPTLAGLMLSKIREHVAACEAVQNLIVAAIIAAADHAALDLIDIIAGTVTAIVEGEPVVSGGWPTGD